MISGLAQVMAIKPILRSFFSGVALSCAIASSAPKGKKEDTAAIAAEEPTAWRKRRRASSLGKSARITADSITRRLSVSASSDRGSSAIANSCSAWLACLPQSQLAPRRTPELNGFEKADMRSPERLVFRGLPHQACQARRGLIRRRDKSLSDKEFTSYFRDSRNAEADGPGIPLVRPGTVLAHAR